jgi:predicted ATP-binding protein involved in virulence
VVGQSDFIGFFVWFKQREDLENEYRIHDSNHRDHQLEAVRSAIASIQRGLNGLNARTACGPFVPELSNLRVQRALMRMVVQKEDSMLYVDQLSEGEKCLLAMVGDLARSLCTANPYADEPLHGGGVVLIDEIELHLHPRWQWQILAALTKTFPGCQFIVATHSPQVMSSAPAGSVRLIDAEHRVHNVERTSGKDTNSLLEDIFGVPPRPANVVEMLHELSRRIEDGQLDTAKALAKELADLLGEDDTQVVSARWEISMAETGDAEN